MSLFLHKRITSEEKASMGYKTSERKCEEIRVWNQFGRVLTAE